MRIAPFTGFEFYAFEIYKEFSKELLTSRKNQIFGCEVPETLRYLICGSLSGVTATCLVYPIDLVKTVLASSKEPNQPILGTMTDLYKTRGFFAMYKGLGATCLVFIIFVKFVIGYITLCWNQISDFSNFEKLVLWWRRWSV